MSFRDLRDQPAEDFFLIHDYPLCVRSNLPVVRTCLGNLYEPFRIGTPPDRAVSAAVQQADGCYRWELGERNGESAKLASALQCMEAAICESIIRSQERRIAIHAACACAGNAATLLIGRGGTGKSTLSLALAGRGVNIATDDVVLVDPDTLRLFPIPRCFHLDSQSLSLLKADGFRFPPGWEELSFLVPGDVGTPVISACGASVLVFVMGKHIEHPLVTTMPKSEMAARLLSETAKGPLDDVATLSVALRLASHASCYRLLPGPLAGTAEAVAALISCGGRAMVDP